MHSGCKYLALVLRAWHWHLPTPENTAPLHLAVKVGTRLKLRLLYIWLFSLGGLVRRAETWGGAAMLMRPPRIAA